MILDTERYDAWLDPKRQIDALLAMLGPYPAERMDAYPVSRRVNDVGNDDESCIALA